MATRPGDVADYVREVVAAFDKAVSLVQKIENRKIEKCDSEASHDLYKSLILGPIIVKGYFDADSKRLGPTYTLGDNESQVQLRDVLLSLKTIVGDLSDVLIEDKEVDFAALQDASDTCRVNAGVCLGQLSQRLADPMRMHLNNPPPQYMSGVPSMAGSGLQYSSSRSTHSSSGERFPMTPDPYSQTPMLSPQYQVRQPNHEREYPAHRRNDTATSIQESYGNWSGTSQLFTERDVDELSIRRPSSTLLPAEEDALLSPRLPKMNVRENKLPGQQDLNRDSYTSFRKPNSPQDSAVPSRFTTLLGRDRYGPDDYFPIITEQHGPSFPDRESGQSYSSYASRATSSGQNDLAQIQEDASSARPEPLRLAHRQSPQQQTISQSSEYRAPPPRRPVPKVPQTPFESYTGHPPINKHTEIPVRMPSHINGLRVPIPPRSDSRPKSSAIPVNQQPTSHTQDQRPPAFMPSMPVQKAMQSSQFRRHHKEVSIDSSPAFAPQALASQQISALEKPFSSPVVEAQTPVHIEPHSHVRGQNLDRGMPPQNLHQAFPTSSVPRTNPNVTSSPVQPNTPQEPFNASAEIRNTNVTTISDTSNVRGVVIRKDPSLSSIPIPQNLPLNLPTEKNTQPFCKSAFRLFLGITKKSFTSATRPVGMTGYIPYWRCDKCLFEGPMAMLAGPPDKKGRAGKPEKVFDPTIRECGPMTSAVVGPDGRGEGSGGIRFKWAFLAKCHVPLKSMPDFGGMGTPDGTIGSFGCLFCLAEGANRGWTTVIHGHGSVSLGLNGPGLNDAASTISGVSEHSVGSGAAGAVPVFGNLALFMDHLQMHRQEENWPCEEMRGRTKCVVGRVADRGEDWEVNFLPI